MPIANADSAVTVAAAPVTFDVLANDTGTGRTIIGITNPLHGRVALGAGQRLTYTPDDGFLGTDSFTYTIRDNLGQTAQGDVTLTVQGANPPPVATDDGAVTTVGTAVRIDVLANDSDPAGQAFGLVNIASPAHGSVTVNADQTLTYMPEGGFIGTDSFTYTIADSGGARAEGTVVVTVELANTPPEATDDQATTFVDQPVTIDMLANDRDSADDVLELIRMTLPAHGIVAVNADQTLTYVPAPGYVGADAFIYTIRDSQGVSSSASVGIAVLDLNTPPLAQPDHVASETGLPVTINALANDTDADGDALAIVAITMPDGGTLAVNPDQTLVYTPRAGFSGIDSFDYVVADGRGGTSTASVFVNVARINRPPVALPDRAESPTGGSVTITPLANDTDPDNDPLTINSITAPGQGTAVANANGIVTYTPAAGFDGTDQFSYIVSDGQGGTASAQVTVEVHGNRPPLAARDAIETTAGQAVTFGPLANDSDPDGDTLTIAAVGTPGHGAAVLNANATVTYTPVAGYVGADSFTYTLNDGRGGSAVGSVAIVVANDNRQSFSDGTLWSDATGWAS